MRLTGIVVSGLIFLSGDMSALADQSNAALSSPSHIPRVDDNPLVNTPNDFRLLIIAPASFGEAIKPLLAHKNATGMPACLVTIESTRGLTGGDDPERIKRCIAMGVKDHGVRYAMLVGDASVCPVRYRRVTQGVSPHTTLDCTYNPSELYYSNLFRHHAVPVGKEHDSGAITHSDEFDTWDANGDGCFNEQRWAMESASFNPDDVDGCPDVALGRVPAHTPAEFAVYAAKVIAYETASLATTKLDSSQLPPGQMTFIADRNYGGSTDGCNELQVLAASALMPGADNASRMEFIPDDIINPPTGWDLGTFTKLDQAIMSSWWVTYFGHAAPNAWLVAEGSNQFDMAHIRTLAGGVHPIIFTIGCESGRFISWQPRTEYLDREGHAHQFAYDEGAKVWIDSKIGKKVPIPLIVPQPEPYDLSERKDLTMACAWLFGSTGKTGETDKMDGAAIAFFGESVVCQNDKGADLLTDVFERYGTGDRVLGDIWLNAQRLYWLSNYTSEDIFRHPRLYLGIMNMFGDPSLRLTAGDEKKKRTRVQEEALHNRSELNKSPINR